jgi:hypothetical protein
MTKRMIYKAYDNEVKKKKYERKAGEWIRDKESINPTLLSV